MNDPELRRIELLEGEYFQRVRETDDALEVGDHATALRHIRKGIVLEELLDAARNELLGGWGDRVRPHAHFLGFATFLAVRGEADLLKRLITACGHSFTPVGARQSYLGGKVTAVPVYDAIRRAVADAPGIQQVTLAKMLGEKTPYIAELAQDLCNAGELVAANVSGRICLWLADYPSLPPAEDRRPTPPHFRQQYAFPRLRSGDEWERLRESFEGTSDTPQVAPGPEGRAALAEMSGHLDKVAVRTWDKQISAYVRRALKDPDFDPLPRRGPEDPEEDYFVRTFPQLDQETRTWVERQVQSQAYFGGREAEARAEVEQVAERVVEELPQDILDQLIVMTSYKDKESLLQERVNAPTSRRLGWTLYYLLRIVKSRHEGDVLDRYSAAAKTLAARGQAKEGIADALGVSAVQVERFLRRRTGQELEPTDPLVTAVPELGEATGGDPLGGFTPRPERPKPLSRLTVDERVALAGHTDDALLLERLGRQGTPRVSEALIERHARAGDLTDDVLRAILDQDRPGSRIPAQLAVANRDRPLPTPTALELAKNAPWTLIDASSETAQQAATVDDDRFRAVLALRNADIDQLEATLGLDEDSPALQILIRLLADRPLPDALTEAPRFIEAVLEASDRSTDPVAAAVLRLTACRNPDVFADYVRAAGAESPGIDPGDLVAATVGRYNLPLSNTSCDTLGSPGEHIGSVREIATRLWTAADLTVEHMLARAIVEEQGEESATNSTKHATFVATADAIRCYPTDQTPTYTYVHLHLTAATEYRAGPEWSLVVPSRLPALGYHREVGKHPLHPEGDEIEAIVWPLPFQPAIYSLEGPSGTPRYLAVSDGKVAFVMNLH